MFRTQFRSSLALSGLHSSLSIRTVSTRALNTPTIRTCIAPSQAVLSKSIPSFTTFHTLSHSSKPFIRSSSSSSPFTHTPIGTWFRSLSTVPASSATTVPPSDAEITVTPILSQSKGVSIWLFACAALVFGMVVVGGLTRLTKSGLSMVEWKVTTIKPPMTQAEWEEEFELYKRFPEYQKMNQGMTLDEFKFIYFMEWSHRVLGRLVGVAFAVPFMYFVAKKQINAPLMKRLALAFSLGGAQGFIGWWMVKSGLEEQENKHGPVHVSPYRLATHLLSAFGIYALLFNTALKTWPSSHVGHGISMANSKPLLRLRHAARWTTLWIAVTVFSGAFVAGNEAGLCYNEFPLMGGRFVPQDIIQPNLQPVWRNAFENSTTVQFDHRILGYTTLTCVTALWFLTRRYHRTLPFGIPKSIRLPTNCLMIMGWTQVTLGISTLLLYVPVPLAATHQAGSLTLLTIAMWLLHALSPLSRVASLAAAGGAVATTAGSMLLVQQVQQVKSTATVELIED